MYENYEDFGQLSMIPLYGHSANLANLNEPLPSAKIDQESLDHCDVYDGSKVGVPKLMIF